MDRRERILEMEAQRQVLSGQIRDLQEEIRKLGMEKTEIDGAEINEHGKFQQGMRFMTPAGTLIRITLVSVKWTDYPATFTYRLEGIQSHERGTFSEKELEKAITAYEWIPLEKESKVKTMPKTVSLREIKMHKEDIYIGYTVQNKAVVFKTSSKFFSSIGREDSFKIKLIERRYGDPEYTLIRRSGSGSHLRSGKRRRYKEWFNITTVEILRYIETSADLVAFLI